MKKELKILLVNLVTSIRMVGVVLLIPIFFLYGGIPAAILSLLCLGTDFLDGYLARKLKASTFFGSLYDGLSDKSYGIISLSILLTKSSLALIPLVFEISIFLTNNVKYFCNQNIKSFMIGKVKTWLLSLSLILSFVILDLTKLNLNDNLENILNKLFIDLYVILIGTEFITLNTYLKDLSHIEKLNKIKIEKDNLLEEKERLYSLKEMLFSPEFYQTNQDKPIKEIMLLRKKKK